MPVKEISEALMANYIQDIFKEQALNEIMLKCDELNIDRARVFDTFGELLVHYAISTGDLNRSSVHNFAIKFQENLSCFEPKNCWVNGAFIDPKRKLSETLLFPQIYKHWCEELKIRPPISFKDIDRITSAIKLQCSKNKFRTHSFNGALEEDVRSKGLDISEEKFAEEFKTLASLTNTPFKQGVLCECELSGASFGYLHKSPERVWMLLAGDGSIKQEKGESDKSYAYRLLDDLIEKRAGNASTSQKQAYLEAGRRIIDFYASTNVRCMAVRKVSKPSSNIGLENNISNVLTLQFSKLPFSVQSKLPKEEKQAFLALLRDKNVEGKPLIIDAFMSSFAKTLGGQAEALNTLKKNVLNEVVANYCLNNYTTSYADGYEIESGKLSRDSFSLATFIDSSRPDAVKQKVVEKNKGC